MRAPVTTGLALAAVFALVPATGFAHPGGGGEGVLHLITSAHHLLPIALGAVLAWQLGRCALRLGTRGIASRQ
jgi:hypothetical protein